MNLPAPAAPPSPELLFSAEGTPAAPVLAQAAADPMLEERNADSVLFKLDQIAPRPSASTPLDRIATPTAGGAPSSQGGSGLIDIKSLMTQTAPSDDEAEVAAPLSSHLESGTSMVAARSSLVGDVQALSATNHSVVAPVVPPAAKRGPLIALCLLAAGALAAALAAVIIRGI